MPPGKDRDLEDTWKPEELERSLKGTKERSKHRDRDGERKKEKHRDDGDDKKRRKKREEDDVDRKERRHHDKENRDKDRERRRRHHDEVDEDRRRKEERRKHREEEGDKEKRHRRHKDDGEDKERRQRKHREEEDDERRKRKEEKRRHRDEGEGSQDRRRHRGEEDRERRHKREENGERRPHRDGSERRHRREEDRERGSRHHREEDQEKRHRRQKEEDEKKSKSKEKEGKERRRHDESSESQKRRKKEPEKTLFVRVGKGISNCGRKSVEKPSLPQKQLASAPIEPPLVIQDLVNSEHSILSVTQTQTASVGQNQTKSDFQTEPVEKPILPQKQLASAAIEPSLVIQDLVNSEHSISSVTQTQTEAVSQNQTKSDDQNLTKSDDQTEPVEKLSLPLKQLASATIEPLLVIQDLVNSEHSISSVTQTQTEAVGKNQTKSDDQNQTQSDDQTEPLKNVQSNLEPTGLTETLVIKREEESDEEEKPTMNGTTAGEDEYNYEDDFEDYEDDFEDEDENENEDDDKDEETEDDEPPPRKPVSELDEIMEAMNRENDRLLSASKRNEWAESPDSYEEDNRRSRPKTSGSRTFINFVSAKQRQISDKVMGKARRRGQELQKLIELDVAAYDMFDMPPVKEYDMYMRSFGRSNAKQVYVQTNEDNLDREIQTEEIEYTEKWSQHPPEELKACGGTDGKDADEETRLLGKPTDSVKLSKFIQRAGQAVLILLEEDLAEKMQGSQQKQQSNICVSESFSSLGKLRLLKGRYVIHSQFSPVQNNLMLTVYSSSEREKHSVDRLGIVCLWNVNEPSLPQKILVCESQPTCCCFSPTKASLAFAGMKDGSVVVWDLREPPSMHKPFQSKDQDFRLRFPTYNTAGVSDEEAHKSAITSLVPIVSAGDSALASLEEGKGDEGEGLSFQLASIEELSVLNLWVVAEISNPDTAGSQSDLGLAPGGRVKLIKSTSVILENPLRDLRVKTSLKSFEMQVNPKSVGHFYVGTDSGCVVHCVRYGAKVTPRAHRPDIDSLVDVTSIDFSPFSEPCFLVGCSDGSVRLHSVDKELPLLCWPQATGGRPVACVRWCRSRPSIFFVLDCQSCLYIWDLLMNDAVAMKEEQISEQRVTSLCLSNDHSATGQGIPGRPPVMGVSLENGAVELHSVSREFSALMPDEIDQFADFLQSIM